MDGDTILYCSVLINDCWGSGKEKNVSHRIKMKHRNVKFQSVLQGEHVGWLLDFIAHLMAEADEDRRETRCSF